MKTVSITVLTDAEAQPQNDRVAIEEPLELRLGFGALSNRQRHRLTVTLRTPGHDEELALGLLRSEGVIRDLADVIGFERGVEENVLRVDLAPDVTLSVETLSRTFASTGSCGLCGKTVLDGISAECEPIRSMARFSRDFLLNLPQRLHEQQTGFAETGGLHAAALFSPQSDCQAIREDIGRHNAVDKVLGLHWRRQNSFETCVIVLSGRAGYELVQKAVRFGVPVIVAIGAPTSLAIDLAQTMNVTLLGFVRDGRGNVYTHPERIEP